jgi:signal transduction histidine kinase
MIIAGDFGAVPAKVLKVLNDVFMNTDRLTRLINIFLNVSRIESGRFEITKQDVDLTALVMEVIDAMKPSAEQKQVALTFHRLDQLLPNIPVDRDKIKDVVLNLVDNAIKYTPKGSIDVSAVSLGDALQVTIKDTGIGIAEGEDRELFKKFVRGDGVAQINTGGSGLGLFIAKKIVEAHGGKIWVESAGKNMGSSFIFTLPKK